MSPVIIHHGHTEEHGDGFESVKYDEETIDCALPLHPEDQRGPRVRYVDDKLRLVEPTLKVRATAMVNDYFINPIIAIFMAMAAMASTTWATTGKAWRMVTIPIRQWFKWILLTLALSMIMAVNSGPECVGSAQRIDKLLGLIDIVALSSIYRRVSGPLDRRYIDDISTMYRRYLN